MKMVRIASFALALVAAQNVSAQVRFSAADVSRSHMPQGQITIRNDQKAITAYRFFGDIQKALFSLKSSRSLATHSYGASIYNTNARVTTLPSQYAGIVQEAAARHGVDPRLIAAVVHQESRFNASAVSPVGALGLMQLMPATAKWLGVNNPMDARENVMGGARYLRTLLDTFHGDLDLTLAAYNAGPGAVQRFRGVPPYRETMNYVSSIKKNYQAAVAAGS